MIRDHFRRDPETQRATELDEAALWAANENECGLDWLVTGVWSAIGLGVVGFWLGVATLGGWL